MINIKDFPYNAIGDGVADDSASTPAALADANVGDGGVMAPGGTFLTGKIDWPGNNLSLRGAASGYGYNSSAAVKTVFRAKPETAIVIDLVQTGQPEDRTGNHISDLEVDGAAIAAVGIDVAGANIIERVRATRCTSAGIRLSNLTNSTKVKAGGLCLNTGYGMVVEGVSTTAFSVEDTVFSLNTLGGALVQAGVLGGFKDCVFESNGGPGLTIYRPNTHNGEFRGFVIENCWFEDNNASGLFALIIDAETRSEVNAPAQITFRNCRFSASYPNRKYVQIGCGKDIVFDDCQFSASTQLDAISLTAEARRVSFLNCSGLTPEQMDYAISQGTQCCWANKGVKRSVTAFANGYSNWGIPFAPAKYWMDSDGGVCLEGSIRPGTIGSAAFTLPVGYRPAGRLAFPVDSNGGYGLLYVNADGTVVPYVGSPTIFNLNGVRFAAG